MNEVDETTGDDEPVSPRGPELEPSDQVTRHELRVAPPQRTETALLLATGVGCCDGGLSLLFFPPHEAKDIMAMAVKHNCFFILIPLCFS